MKQSYVSWDNQSIAAMHAGFHLVIKCDIQVGVYSSLQVKRKLVVCFWTYCDA